MKESAEQVLVIKWWDDICSDEFKCWKNALFHIPNGGYRNVVEATNLKRQGVRSGVPDLALLIPNGSFHALFIELKRQGGKPSESQIEYLRYLKKSGYCAFVVEGHINAEKLIYQYLNDPNSLNEINDENIKYDQPVVIDEMVI